VSPPIPPRAIRSRLDWTLANLIILSLTTALALWALDFAIHALNRQGPPPHELATYGVLFILGFMLGMDAVWGQRERERLRYYAKRLRGCAMVDGYAEESFSKFDCAELADLIEGR
jgi:hypothetical protein